jgi:hypothetical protein
MNQGTNNSKEENLFFLNFAKELIDESILSIDRNDFSSLCIHIEYLRILCNDFDFQLERLLSQDRVHHDFPNHLNVANRF